MTEFKIEEIRDQLAFLQGRLARQEAELARYRRRRHIRPLLPCLAVGLLVALAPLAVLAANPFNDLNPGSVHNANIDAIYNAGVTTGCTPTDYCPDATVTREEMASFLARLGGLGANPPVANAARLASSPTGVGGPTYAANDLVRVARSAPPGQLFTLTRSSYTTLATVKITVPGPGFVLVTGGTTVDGTGRANVRLRDASADPDPVFASPILIVAVDASTQDSSATPTYAFQATGAGPKSYVIEALGDTTLLAGGASAQVTALYVPFGPAGGTTP